MNLKPNPDDVFERQIYCEKCKKRTDHSIVLNSSSGNLVMYYCACHGCYSKQGNGVYDWNCQISRIVDYNSLIVSPEFKTH